MILLLGTLLCHDPARLALARAPVYRVQPFHQSKVESETILLLHVQVGLR